MDQPLCAVSVDLDEIPHYRELHGLAPSERGASAVHEVALGRMAAFGRACRLPLTLFAVGRELERGAAAAPVAELARAGHAVENHSWGHGYDLTRYGRTRMRDEVAAAHRLIEAVTGRAPVGFRAPGYTLSDELLDVLDELGYRFDSSVFPCPSYYGAKAAVMAGMWLRGRRSAAVLDTPRVLLAPTQPYRPGRPWHRRGGEGLMELPVQVTPWARLPFIGTTLVLAGPTGARWLARWCAQRPFVNLELHGIDFLEAADGLADLAPVQPDLRVSLTRKLAALEAAVAELRRAGHRFVTLAEAAAHVQVQG